MSDVIHLCDRFTDLLNTYCLLMAGITNLMNDLSHASHTIDNFVHCQTSLINELRACTHFFNRVIDQSFDFSRCGRTTLCKVAYFRRNNGKSPSLLACACSFYSGIQRKNVCLERNGIDDADNIGNFSGRFID